MLSNDSLLYECIVVKERSLHPYNTRMGSTMKAQRKDKKIVKRNDAITNQAILESAVRLFVKRSYDGLGVREIAAEVGVTAMMVNHYVSPNQLLFAELGENRQ